MRNTLIRYMVLALILFLFAGCGSSEETELPARPEADSEAPAVQEGSHDRSLDGAAPDQGRNATRADRIVWRGYAEGMELSRNKEKKVFLNFYADWCRYCKEMDQKTFKDKAVIVYLNDNFIPIRVNSDKEPKTASDYQVTGLPVSWFLSEKGERIGSQPGYIPPDSLLTLLKYIETDSYQKMKFTDFVKTM